jgi:hypothetical protein
MRQHTSAYVSIRQHTTPIFLKSVLMRGFSKAGRWCTGSGPPQQLLLLSLLALLFAI